MNKTAIITGAAGLAAASAAGFLLWAGIIASEPAGITRDAMLAGSAVMTAVSATLHAAWHHFPGSIKSKWHWPVIAIVAVLLAFETASLTLAQLSSLDALVARHAAEQAAIKQQQQTTAALLAVASRQGESRFRDSRAQGGELLKLAVQQRPVVASIDDAGMIAKIDSRIGQVVFCFVRSLLVIGTAAVCLSVASDIVAAEKKRVPAKPARSAQVVERKREKRPPKNVIRLVANGAPEWDTPQEWGAQKRQKWAVFCEFIHTPSVDLGYNNTCQSLRIARGTAADFFNHAQSIGLLRRDGKGRMVKS